MLLRECRVLAELAADQKIRDAIITVPPYFNQAERRALADAADLAGINLLQVRSLPRYLRNQFLLLANERQHCCRS